MKKLFILIIVLYSCEGNPTIERCDYGWCLTFGHTELKKADFDSIFTIKKLSKADSASIKRILYRDAMRSTNNRQPKRGWKY